MAEIPECRRKIDPVCSSQTWVIKQKEIKGTEQCHELCCSAFVNQPWSFLMCLCHGTSLAGPVLQMAEFTKIHAISIHKQLSIKDEFINSCM